MLRFPPVLRFFALALLINSAFAQAARDRRTDRTIRRRSIVTRAIAPAAAHRAVDIGDAIAFGCSIAGIGAVSDAAARYRCAAHARDDLVCA